MIRPFGEAALLVETGDATRARALAADLAREPIAGVGGLVPGLESLLVELDPRATTVADVDAALRARLSHALPEPPPGRRRTIPVVYGGEWGPDLPGVAELTGLSEAEVVAAHADAELRVLVDGFAPGFAYLGDLPDALRLPRLDTPRTWTPAGSVAIAGAMSGIYPADLPGGWRVIGRTPITLFDPRRHPPAYLLPGDTVRFEPVDPRAWDAHAGTQGDWG